MSIRIGANPIGWTNDDLQDIGGDTPLETCLAQAKEAGVVGMEKGHKMPSDGAALKDKLAEFGLTFVGGWYSAELLKRSARDEFKAAKSHIAMTKGAGTDIVHRGRDLERHPRRPLQAFVRTPASAQRRLGRVRRQDDRVCRATGRRRAQALLSSSHGHDHPVGTRHRRAHGPHQAARASAARHRTRALGRRRSGGAGARLSIAHRSCALQGRARGEDARIERRRLELPRFDLRAGQGAWRLYRAGRRRGRLCRRCSRSSRAIPAGSSSKPSRTRRKPPPCPTRKRAWRTSAPR